MKTAQLLALIATLGVTGCVSSNYRPTVSPRVSRVWDGGAATYYKNGKKYDHLTDAVEDNARAVTEARTARTLNIWANALIFGAVGTEVAGFAMIGAGQTDTVQEAGGALVLASLGAVIAGFFVGAHAVPHAEDAMNIYNDGLLERAPSPPAGSAAPSFRP